MGVNLTEQWSSRPRLTFWSSISGPVLSDCRVRVARNPARYAVAAIVVCIGTSLGVVIAPPGKGIARTATRVWIALAVSTAAVPSTAAMAATDQGA